MLEMNIPNDINGDIPTEISASCGLGLTCGIFLHDLDSFYEVSLSCACGPLHQTFDWPRERRVRLC